MAIKTTWERPDGRRQLTVTAPLFVDQGPRRVRVVEWGLAGLVYPAGSRGLPRPQDEVDLRLALPFQGFEVAFPVRVRVVSVDPAEEVVTGEFLDLGDREREVMRHFIDGLVRGTMAEVGETIGRLDVPQSAAPLSGLDEPPAETGAQAVASPGSRARAAAYAGLAAIAVLWLGSAAVPRVWRFEVERAVLSVPSRPLLAGADGHVHWTGARPGARVAAGDPVARITDIGLEREIALADIAMREREAQLSHLRQKASSDDSPGVPVKTAALRKSPATQAAGATPSELEIGLEFVRERHAALLAQRERLVIRAPQDGVLLAMPASDQTYVRNGEAVAVVAPASEPLVTAWLQPAEALPVAVGDRARVWIPRTREFATAEVVSMHWQGGDEHPAPPLAPTGVGPSQAAGDRWTTVTLRLVDADPVKNSGVPLTSGLPVTVAFNRGWTTALAASVRDHATGAVALLRDGLRYAYPRTTSSSATVTTE
jgi:multidrug resistance efflux pump